jgi:glycosyltransferase involved in cell wall biosynthesis
MTKLGIFVGEDKWMFFGEIFEDLANRFNMDVYSARYVKTPLLYGRLNRWLFRRQLLSLLHNNDVCFFEWASDLLAPASHLSKRSKIVTRLHSFELYEWAPRINWDFVDKVILVSEAMRRKFGELYPAHLHKTEVIYNGVSLQDFAPSCTSRHSGLTIGLLCNIKPVKRVYEAVLMLHSLRGQGLDAQLHVAGVPEGDLRYAAAVYRLVNKLHLDEAVCFHGHVADTAEWLRQIDIFVSNSYWEGHQVALVEAMATGCYCLSHFWDGAEESLPPEHLFATESELLQKISEYLDLSAAEQQERRALMRAIACEKFDLADTKARIHHVIEELAASAA